MSVRTVILELDEDILSKILEVYPDANVKGMAERYLKGIALQVSRKPPIRRPILMECPRCHHIWRYSGMDSRPRCYRCKRNCNIYMDAVDTD